MILHIMLLSAMTIQCNMPDMTPLFTLRLQFLDTEQDGVVCFLTRTISQNG